MNPSDARRAVWSLLLAFLPAASFAQTSFPVTPPDAPIILPRAAPAIPAWGQAGPMRLIYHVGLDQAFNDLDRRTIMRQIQLIKDFYLHFGLAVSMEDVVWEVQSGTQTSKYDYKLFKSELARRGLYVPGRTIVFNAFDMGLGGYGEMAFTSINDQNNYDYECGAQGNHNAAHGHPWWCGIAVEAHWGGILHEVGHMLGLAHDDEIMAGKIAWVNGRNYAYCDGSSGLYASPGQMPHALMTLGYRTFATDPEVGLLPSEVDFLCRAHAPDACGKKTCGVTAPE